MAGSATDLWEHRNEYAAKFAAQASQIAADIQTLKAQIETVLPQLITAIINGDTAAIERIKQNLPDKLRQAIDTAVSFALKLADMAADKLTAYNIGYLVGQLLYEAAEDAVVTAAWTALTGVTLGAASPSAAPLMGARVANFINKLRKGAGKVGIDLKFIDSIKDKVEAAMKWTGKHADDLKDAEKKLAQAAEKGLEVAGDVGCFVAGTPCWVAIRVPEFAVAGDGHDIGAEERSVIDCHEAPIPIEEVVLGQRVLTRNPRPDFAAGLSTNKDYSTWKVIRMEVRHANGSVVDVELLRSDDWIERHSVAVGKRIDLNLTEIEVDARAIVESIDDGPVVIPGAGAVVTGRFVTRHCSDLVRVTYADGTELVGTRKHPVWSPEENDWRGLGDFLPGEPVLSRDGELPVIATERLESGAPVYNIEVDGEHVYEVTDAGILVHNSGTIDCTKWLRLRKLRLAGELTDPKDIDDYKNLLKQIRSFRDFLSPEDLKHFQSTRPDSLAMPNSHLHHILQKLGNSAESAKEILEAQEILWNEYGINPFTDIDILVWAKNGVPGMHGAKPAKKIVDAIKQAASMGMSETELRQLLKDLGAEAARKR